MGCSLLLILILSLCKSLCSDYAADRQCGCLVLPSLLPSTANPGSVAGLGRVCCRIQFVISLSSSCVSSFNTFCYNSDWRKFKRANKIRVIREAACKPHLSLNSFPFFFGVATDDNYWILLLSCVQPVLREEN